MPTILPHLLVAWSYQSRNVKLTTRSAAFKNACAPFDSAVLGRSKLDATTEARTVNHKFLSTAQLIDRLNVWKRQARMSTLRLFNLQKKAAILIKNLALEKRILLLIAQNNIPGVRRVLAQALKQGSSSQGILGKL